MKKFTFWACFFLFSISVVYPQDSNIKYPKEKGVSSSVIERNRFMSKTTIDSVKQKGQKSTIINSEINDQNGYTLILTDCKDDSEVTAAQNFILKQGGSVAIIGSKNVMIGWIDPSISKQLIGKYGITAVQYRPVDLKLLNLSDRQSLQTVAYFNSATSVRGEQQQKDERLEMVTNMNVTDCLPRPAISIDDYMQNMNQNKLNIQSLQKDKKLISLRSDGSLLSGNSDVMVGTIAVAVFMIESNGAIDLNKYTWSTADEDSAYQRTLRDLSWWSKMAAKYGKTVSFKVIPYYHTDSVCQVPYEPILHSQTEDGLWIGSIMNNIGFKTGTHFTKVESYNSWLRSTYNTDWAYSIFLAYNPSPAPYSFTNGYTGYAYYGGPYTQIVFSCFKSDQVVSHETGHIFWANDEYTWDNKYSLYNSRDIPNGNSEYINNNSVDCMMKGNTKTLCSYTPAQLGWRSKVPQYIVETNPQGLLVNVQNLQKSSPQEFPWGVGTMAEISVVTPQVINGKKYEFLSWSDGGALSHSIIIPDTTTRYIANFSLAGEAPQTWTQFPQSNALQNSYVNDVSVDKQGGVWVGTNGGGLCNFDGRTWKSYTNVNSGLPANTISTIATDEQGNKWIGVTSFISDYLNGTYVVNGGLVKFDGINWTVYNSTNSGLPINSDIRTIVIDNSGNKWIGTVNGLVKFDNSNWTVYTPSNSGLPNSWINAIAIDESGNKWIGTSYGLAKFDGSSWAIFNTSNSGIPGNTINSISIDNLGNKWIGTTNGLVKFDGSSWTIFNKSNSGIPENAISSISIDNLGNKWIGTENGLVKFDDTNWTNFSMLNLGIPSNYITSIYIDCSGNKWIGTKDGLAKYDDTYWTSYNVFMGIPDKNINTVKIDKQGNKWIGTRTGGILKFDGTNWTVYNNENSGLNNHTIHAIAIDDSGNKWIGTSYGLAKFDGTNWTIYNSSTSGLNYSIGAIEIDGYGNKWIGGGGLVKFDGSNFTIYNTANSGIPSDGVRSIAIDRSGNIWIGTFNGLAKFDGSNWTVYNTTNSGIPDNDIYSLAIDRFGNKWIGTLEDGLAKFDGTTWTIYNQSNSGLPENGAYTLAIDSLGILWISSSGLVKFDGTNWTVYNTANSVIPSDGIYSIAIDNFGNKWIGTWEGLAVYNENGVNITVPSFLSVSSTSANFEAKGGSEFVKISSNSVWNTSSNQAWLSVSPKSYSSDTVLTLTAQANLNATSRSAKVMLTIPINGITKIITISQLGNKELGLNDTKKESILISPNPTFEFFNLFGLEGLAKLSLFDINGRLLLKKEVSAKDNVSVGALSKGIYIVKLITNDGTFEMKLVKK